MSNGRKHGRIEAIVTKHDQEAARVNLEMRQMRSLQTNEQDQPELDNRVRRLRSSGFGGREFMIKSRISRNTESARIWIEESEESRYRTIRTR